MNQPQERRWSWYSQIVDALFAIAGLVLLAVMTIRNSYPIYGVLLVLVFAGRVSASSILRLLVARWEGNGK